MFSYEQMGWIPRSIIRTFQRFFEQIGFQGNLFAIYEFRVSRYFAIASIQCFIFLILCPWIVQFFMKIIVVQFFINFNFILPIFLNFYQKKQAFLDLNNIDKQIYFDALISIFKGKSESILETFKTDWIYQIANFYLNQSLKIIINWIIDLITLIFFLSLLFFCKTQIIILKTFLIELLFSFSETTKCFFIIFFLDLLVGFHSSKSWEIFFQLIIGHFGFQISKDSVFFFISTFPVLLDTFFKYWIFRYLNKISPSTVAIYQSMLE